MHGSVLRIHTMVTAIVIHTWKCMHGIVHFSLHGRRYREKHTFENSILVCALITGA